MNAVWVAEVDKVYARELARLRLLANVEIGETEEGFWLRGTCPIEDAAVALSSIPHVQLYHVEAGGGLRPVGLRLVAKQLPTIEFRSLSKSVAAVLPRAAYPDSRVSSIQMSLVRSDREQRSVLLETSLAEWSEYASSAPQVRLNRWAFAVSAEGRVLVRGEPLPSLPGRHYWLSEGVAIPIGWTCQPAISGPVLSQVLSRHDGHLILLNEDGTMESIANDAFVHATRSAVRSTQRATAP